jgi:hypothetical protein
MSDVGHLYSLVKGREYAAALKFLDGCNDNKARQQLVYTSPWNLHDDPIGMNALAAISCRRDAPPAELIRAMVERGPHNYINSESGRGHTPIVFAARNGNAILLDFLLTLGAESIRNNAVL